MMTDGGGGGEMDGRPGRGQDGDEWDGWMVGMGGWRVTGRDGWDGRRAQDGMVTGPDGRMVGMRRVNGGCGRDGRDSKMVAIPGGTQLNGDGRAAVVMVVG